MAERHALDVVPLTAGLMALSLSALALVSRADVLEVDGLVVLATLWIVLGVVGLSRSVHRLVRRTEGRDVGA